MDRETKKIDRETEDEEKLIGRKKDSRDTKLKCQKQTKHSHELDFELPLFVA